MPRDYDAFISYTRQQGAPLAERVLDLLKGNSFKVWQDHTHMRGGEDFWHQIETAIERAYYLILVLTPDAFEGDRLILRDEWLTARRRGCAVLPIFGGDDSVDFSSPLVPAWIKKLDCYNLDNANHRIKLLNDLRTTPLCRSIPHSVEFPANFVRREDEMTAIVSALTESPADTHKAIITALRGGGGFGKTTLAKALCFEDSILARYTDGVLWLTVGEGERSPANLLTTLLQELDQSPKSTNEDALFGQWQETLRSRACLVVLDDVWKESDALTLIVRETESAFLITTRIPRVVTAVDALDCLVVEMRDDHAINLLGLPLGEAADKFEDRLYKLVKKAGNWPILLGLIAGQLRHIMRRPGATPEQALALIDEDLTDLGLTAYDRQNSNERADAVARTIAASLKYLTESCPASRADERYLELAVFPDDVFLEIAVLQDLWRMSRAEARRLAEAFDDAGLATLDLSHGLHLHDVFLEYLRTQLDAMGLCALNQQLLQSWPDQYQLPHSYAWRWYGWHCLHGGVPERLAAALLDFQWLSIRLDHAFLSSLLTDYDRILGSLPNKQRSFVGLRDTLELSSHVLLRDPKQFATQLYGRLRQGQTSELDALIAQAKQALSSQILHPFTQNLRPEGSSLKRILQGHLGKVNGAMEIADGRRLLSWSADGKMGLWTVDGTPLGIIVGHEGEIKGAMELADGRVLSWSDDKTLRWWDANGDPLFVLNTELPCDVAVIALSGDRILFWSTQESILVLWPLHSDDSDPVKVLRGHKGHIRGALELADGRLVSWSRDRTLRLWAADGTTLGLVMTHVDDIDGVIELSDGRLLSWSFENLWICTAGSPLLGEPKLMGESIFTNHLTLKDGRLLCWHGGLDFLFLWLADFTAFCVLTGHEGHIRGALELADGRLLSWSVDNTLRLWAPDGTALGVLAEHKDSVTGALELADGRLISWGDKTLRLWAADGTALGILRGYEGWIAGTLNLSTGQLLTWSSDKLYLWSPTSENLEVVSGHDNWVEGSLALPDGRLLSWAYDWTLRLWASDGTALGVLMGHEYCPSGALALANGRLLSWSEDETIRQWTAAGEALKELTRRQRGVGEVLQLADGSILSWGYRECLEVWTPDSPPSVVLFREDNVHGVLELTGGRILFWSNDETLRLWQRDFTTLGLLAGHEGKIKSALELDDGRLLSWSDDKTLRLWAADGTPLGLLTGHEGTINGALELDDGRLLSWSDDKTLRLWSADGVLLQIVSGHENSFFDAKKLADGRLLVNSNLPDLGFWAADGRVLVVPDTVEYFYNVLEFSDGRLLFSSQRIHDWPSLQILAKDGKSLKDLKGHTQAINGVLILEDGRFLSWSNDSTLRLWSRSGDQLGVLYFDGAIQTVTKVPGISRFLVGETSGGVHWVNVN